MNTCKNEITVESGIPIQTSHWQCVFRSPISFSLSVTIFFSYFDISGGTRQAGRRWGEGRVGPLLTDKLIMGVGKGGAIWLHCLVPGREELWCLALDLGFWSLIKLSPIWSARSWFKVSVVQMNVTNLFDWKKTRMTLEIAATTNNYFFLLHSFGYQFITYIRK